ncbi:hypothetical protein ACFL5G_04290 [Candidatus Margulisiibacteriota bacterium]
MKSMWRMLLVFVMAAMLAGTAQAAVDLYVVPSVDVVERNSENGIYNVVVKVKADTATEVEALGDIFISYDLNVFDEVVTASFTDNAGGYLAWEASQVNLSYATNGTIRTIHYGKANSQGDNWNMTSGVEYAVFTLSLFAKNDAVTGDTLIAFDEPLCHVINGVSHADVIDEITGATYDVTVDNTAPISTIHPAPGIYLGPQNVYIDTNESNHEALVHFTTNNWVVEHITSDPTFFVNISGVADEVHITTFNYFAEDLAQDTTHNSETPTQEATYVIDMQAPDITVTTYNAETIGIGSEFSITFIASEELRSYPTATVGGLTMSGIGSGAGPYTFTRTLTGGEDPAGAVVIQGRDLAEPGGNLGQNTSFNADLDFGGPDFVINTTPDPVYVEEELIVTFSASEQLSGTPDVLVGRVSADWYAEDLIVPEYEYRVTVSAYGWLLELGPDSEPPYTFEHYPSFNETNVDPQSNIIFRIADIGSGVASESIFVRINGVSAVSSGSITGEFSGTISADGHGGFLIAIIPVEELPRNTEITIEVEAVDLSPSENALDPLVYAFWTGSGGELKLLAKPVAIPTVFDPRDTNTEIVYKLSMANDIELRIYDMSGTLVWSDIYAAGATGGMMGLNQVPWDGRTGHEMILSNGVYMFYVIEQSKRAQANVLGHGKVVILKD